MNHQECLLYLEKIQNLGIKFGLDNVRAILDSLGNPHRKYPSILVAGSNGKGSVCAMITQILSLHNLRVGLFTSPHLVRVEERIRIGNELISGRNFCFILTQLKEKIEELIQAKILISPPTYFELMTCLALVFFGQQKVDIAVLEVGMGGRFDATNVVDPLVTVITTISAEHQKFLGESLEQIALEKAGIARRGVPMVCGVEEEKVLSAIKKRTQELGAPFYEVFEKKESFSPLKLKQEYSFTYKTEKREYRFSPALRGLHQGLNAAVALVAAEKLSQNWRRLDKAKMIQGIETCQWEGRLEVVFPQPVVILDGAHNEEGACALRQYIHDFVSSPLILIFAIMRDKKVDRMADILFPLAQTVILTRFPYFRAATPEEIRAKITGFEELVLLEEDPGKAFQLALQKATPQHAVVVAGSLYIVGEIKKILVSKRQYRDSALR
ncbi:MAG: bifunctional folylpolyglutamate synthase/dihydrofolate synthase [Candidatus Aminicenantes bacterium]